METCCGTTCDKGLLEKQLKTKGAAEFVLYLEQHITEDCSTEAIAVLLNSYIRMLYR